MCTYEGVVVENDFHLEFLLFVDTGLAVNAHVTRRAAASAVICRLLAVVVMLQLVAIALELVLV